jgi:hypothetical protein
VVDGSFDTALRMAGGLVRAEGNGEVTRLEVDLLHDERISYRANIFVELALAVRISGVPYHKRSVGSRDIRGEAAAGSGYRYEGWGRVTLDLHPVLHDDLTIFIEVPDVTPAEVTLELRPLGRVAGLLDQLGGVNEQVRREIVRFVNARKEDPRALEQRKIDVAWTIEAEWERRRQAKG